MEQSWLDQIPVVPGAEVVVVVVVVVVAGEATAIECAIGDVASRCFEPEQPRQSGNKQALHRLVHAHDESTAPPNESDRLGDHGIRPSA
jgi:hypothetical protein